MGLIESKLLDHRERLLSYILGKVADPALAEDILQDSLLKALRAAPKLRQDEKVVSWFYQIVNHAIVDAYRRRGIESRVLTEFDEDREALLEPEEEAMLCACFRELLPTLKPEYAEVIEALDLTDGDPARVADHLGITANNLKVRRHRARQALRQRLEETCRVCATHSCLDCTCRIQTIRSAIE